MLAPCPDEVRQVFLIQADCPDRLVLPNDRPAVASGDLLLTGLEKSVWIRTKSHAEPAKASMAARVSRRDNGTFSGEIQNAATAPVKLPAPEVMSVCQFAWSYKRTGAAAEAIPEPSAASAHANPATLSARAGEFLEHLAARAYSQGSIDAHRWAFAGFLEWAQDQGHASPAAFTRATLESYQLHLHRYRSPRTHQPLVVNTQIARLGCIRRLFAWLCRTGAPDRESATRSCANANT